MLQRRSILFYQYLLFILCIGIILSITTIILKTAANDFAIWHQAVDKLPALAQLVQEYPILNFSHYTFLSDLAWHQSEQLHAYLYYIRYFIFNSFLLILLFKSRCLYYLNHFAEWSQKKEHQQVRLITLTAIALPITCFICKMYISFLFPAISGWTYKNLPTKITPITTTTTPIILPDSLAFLKSSLVLEHNKYLSKTGNLTYDALFLHFTSYSYKLVFLYLCRH